LIAGSNPVPRGCAARDEIREGTFRNARYSIAGPWFEFLKSGDRVTTPTKLRKYIANMSDDGNGPGLRLAKHRTAQKAAKRAAVACWRSCDRSRSRRT